MADQTYAVHCGFFDAIDSDRTYSADEMNRPYRRVISNGVFATPQGNPSTDLQVVESTGMNIICKAGEGLFADKWFENPSSIVITVPNNTSTVPRIDSVLVQVDTRTSGRVGNIVYRTGTPASSPVPPAINQTEGVVEYRLANIRVNAGVTSIAGRYITDRRGSSDCPWVTSLIYQVDTSTLYDQWQAAYAEYFEEEKAIWDAWYSQLTEDLDVSMTLDRHVNTVTTDAQTTGYIPIGLAYNHNTDILEVYINGLRAVEGTHYVVVDDTKILVENQLQIGQTVTFVVMRSVISGSATNIMVLLQELESQIAGIAGGTPTVVDSTSDMTDTDKIYILSTDGKWYYYSATQEDWVIGGTYGGVPTDTTLTQEGMAADAKAVGDALAEKADSSDVTALDTRVTEVEGDVSDVKSAIEYVSDGKVYYPYDIVQNSYVKTNGSFAAYNGWSRTGYIAVEPNTKLYLTNPVRAPYSAWYNANYEFVSRLDLQPGNPVVVTVPSDVYYLAISAETSDLFTAIWSYIPLVDETLTQAHKAADAKETGDKITNIEEDLGGGSVVYTTPLSQRINGYYARNPQTNKIVTSESDTYYTIEPVDISMLKLGSTVKMNTSLTGSYGIFIVDSGLNVLDYINGENAVDRGYSVTSTPVLVSMTVPANAKYIVSDIRNAYYVSMDDFNVSGIEKSNITVLMEKSETASGNVLHGKKWVACGDSFTEGDFHNSLTDDYTFTSGLYAGENKVYPFWIGRRNPDLTVINEAISGSTMAAGSNGVNPFSGTRYTAIPADADYITLEFGINDSGHGVPIGTIDDADNTTFYGAWNVVLGYFAEHFPFAHIGIIVGPGMQTSNGQQYANAEIAVAKKWGIPYLNVQFESGGGKIPLMLRTSNPDVSVAAKNACNARQFVNPSSETPNYHPNEKAHEFESAYIEAWLRTL